MKGPVDFSMVTFLQGYLSEEIGDLFPTTLLVCWCLSSTAIHHSAFFPLILLDLYHKCQHQFGAHVLPSSICHCFIWGPSSIPRQSPIPWPSKALSLQSVPTYYPFPSLLHWAQPEASLPDCILLYSKAESTFPPAFWGLPPLPNPFSCFEPFSWGPILSFQLFQVPVL